jgi:MinD superfamily P-loop ATPase
MKQLLILSGKGGTGKTTIASAFIKLSGAKAYADCDVDAPNLHLIMKQTANAINSDYFGMPKAVIDSELCRDCGACKLKCRFDAISFSHGYLIDQYACEGCGICAEICPAAAITLLPSNAGDLKLFENYDKSVFSTAQLKMGSGASGKLVTEVKKQMTASVNHADFAIIDGSPGIGCPVIASLSGVDMVLIVAEPSVSGISDMNRIIITAERFKVKTAVCINKYNTNFHNTELIISYCKKYQLPFVGKIPFDKKAVEAINSGLSIVDIDCASGEAVKEVYNKIISQPNNFNEDKNEN